MQSRPPPTVDASLPAALRWSPRQVPGTEPSCRELGRVGVLLLHGYTGSPWEVRPLLPIFDDLGWSHALPVLCGHGTSVDDLEGTTWQDWLRSGTEAAEWLADRCDRIHVVALSMGCLLAIKLLVRDLGVPWVSCVLLAPALTLGTPTERAIGLMQRAGWPRRLGKNPPKLARNLLPPAYWQIPVGQTAGMLELAVDVRSHVQSPAVPTLVLHGNLDRTIPMRRTRRFVHTALPHATHEVVVGAGHLLPRTRQAKRVFARIKGFVVEREREAAPRDATK